MRAVTVEQPGDASVLRVAEVPTPEPGPGEIRIRVGAFAVNRADLLQREGRYPPPPGASPLLGLECAGRVDARGPGAARFGVGDRVMALLAGGGYAEQVVVHETCAMAVPERLSIEQAAAIPEVFLTVFLNVFQLGGLAAGGALLVHGGGSGIGTAAIQLAKAAGASVIVTAGSGDKCERCRALGADVAVNYREASFLEAVKQATGGRGVGVVLDSIGAPYLADNLAALAVEGALVVIGLMGGTKAELNLALLVARRLRIVGSTMRARPIEEKGALIDAFEARFGPDLAAGRVTPVIDRVLSLDQVEDAHRAMRASEHFGKLVVRVG
jgi:putative PIG3 family NAD(P)H quinone oxidoreductase